MHLTSELQCFHPQRLSHLGLVRKVVALERMVAALEDRQTREGPETLVEGQCSSEAAGHSQDEGEGHCHSQAAVDPVGGLRLHHLFSRSTPKQQVLPSRLSGSQLTEPSNPKRFFVMKRHRFGAAGVHRNKT